MEMILVRQAWVLHVYNTNNSLVTDVIVREHIGIKVK